MDLAAGLDAWRDLEHPAPLSGRVPKRGFVVRVPAHDFRLIAID